MKIELKPGRIGANLVQEDRDDLAPPKEPVNKGTVALREASVEDLEAELKARRVHRRRIADAEARENVRKNHWAFSKRELGITTFRKDYGDGYLADIEFNLAAFKVEPEPFSWAVVNEKGMPVARGTSATRDEANAECDFNYTKSKVMRAG